MAYKRGFDTRSMKFPQSLLWLKIIRELNVRIIREGKKDMLTPRSYILL
jgi:hypothetical protein